MIRLGKLIVDGMFFNDLPSKLDQVLDEDYGVRYDAHRTLGSRRIIVTESAQIETPNNYRYKRKIHQQAWRFGWEQDSFASPALFELLNELYETQRHFWIQSDDEMSRCWGRCLTVGNDIYDNLSPHAYFTPTYPIFPYGHEPGDDVNDWSEKLMIEGQLWEGPFTVDRETGLVLIAPDRSLFTHRTKVHLQYTWRAYVRIKSLELYAYELAQTYYVGEVVLEQVPIPAMGAEIVWRDEPYTRSCFYFSDNRIRVFAQLQIAGRVGVPKVVGNQITFAAVRVYASVNASKFGTTENPFPHEPPGGVYGALRMQAKVVAAGSGTSFQMLRPNGDTNSAWSTNGASRWSVIDDPVVDEADYISGGSTAQTGTLTPGIDPGIDTDHILTVSWRRNPPITTVLTAQLYQGAILIASTAFTATVSGRIDSSYTLSPTEAGNITDYTDLRWSVSCSTSGLVFALALQIPSSGGNVIKNRIATGSLRVTAKVVPYRGIISAGMGVYPVRIVAKVIATKDGHVIDNPTTPDNPGPGGSGAPE